MVLLVVRSISGIWKPEVAVKKKILALSVALVCLGAQALAVPTPTGDTLYDTAINQLATDASDEGRTNAIALLESASEQGDPRAPMRLGALALQEVQRDGDAAYHRALTHYRTAVILKADRAQTALAITSAQRAFRAGSGTEFGKALLVDAFPHLQEAAPTGDALVLWYLGFLEVTGLAGKTDRSAGINHLIASAESGNGPAAMWLANHYAGLVPAATESEVRYLRIAHARGIRAAGPRLDVYDAYAAGSAPVSGAAIGAANQQTETVHVAASFASSSTVEGAALAQVSNADPELQEIRRLDQKLAETTRELEAVQRKLDAALRIPHAPSTDVIKINNEGLEAVLAGDYETATAKFREASRLEYAPAIANLGSLYLNGTGLPRDGGQAIALFKKAAKKGNLVAAENIARAYDFGLGVHPDRSRAIQWYQNAEKMGSQTAGDAIRRLKSS